ncbi:hypothetical protein [Candidatus Acidianus copahuensis]|uniref:hypothetical protein n=1 Tax=Candidatus Acidianus copahuensis TaxID=1160895 RepID=UPI00190F89D0|nr:hypothetical protein [Candidatus Acidianus copahuensis]
MISAFKQQKKEEETKLVNFSELPDEYLKDEFPEIWNSIRRERVKVDCYYGMFPCRN